MIVNYQSVVDGGPDVVLFYICLLSKVCVVCLHLVMSENKIAAICCPSYFAIFMCYVKLCLFHVNNDVSLISCGGQGVIYFISILMNRS